MSTNGQQPSPNGPEFQPGSEFPPSGSEPRPPSGALPPTSGEPLPPTGGEPGEQDPYANAHAAGFPEPQPPTKAGLNLKALVPIVLAVAVGGFVLWNNFGGGPDTASAGECIVLSGTHEDVSHETVDCNDSATFSYLVGAIHDGDVACELDAVPYTVGTERNGNYRVDKTMCLVEHFHVDECYEFVDTVQSFQRADCGAVNEGFRLTERLDEAHATCTNGEPLWTYSEPPLTYCGEPAG